MGQKEDMGRLFGDRRPPKLCLNPSFLGPFPGQKQRTVHGSPGNSFSLHVCGLKLC